MTSRKQPAAGTSAAGCFLDVIVHCQHVLARQDSDIPFVKSPFCGGIFLRPYIEPALESDRTVVVVRKIAAVAFVADGPEVVQLGVPRLAEYLFDIRAAGHHVMPDGRYTDSDDPGSGCAPALIHAEKSL